MESKLGNVARLPIVNNTDHRSSNSASNLPHQPTNIHKHDKNTVDFAKAVILGFADLIQGQRQFADEFGLSLNRVFPNSYNALHGHRAKDVVATLFQSGNHNAKEVKNLFNDLITHQVAIFSALDGIAEESLEQLKPNDIQYSKTAKVRDAHAWRIFKQMHSEYVENSNRRFEKIVSNGFIKKYIYSRKENRTKIKK